MKDHETPFPLYQALKMHGYGRQKKQLENAHDFGLSVSYGRDMEVIRAIAQAVCNHRAEDGVVLPTNLQSNVFVTMDSDNMGNFSQDEFHGTALIATNHLSAETRHIWISLIHLCLTFQTHIQSYIQLNLAGERWTSLS